MKVFMGMAILLLVTGCVTQGDPLRTYELNIFISGNENEINVTPDIRVEKIDRISTDQDVSTDVDADADVIP